MKNLLKVAATILVGCAALLLVEVRVRANAPPGHFTDEGDGTVRDNATGLVWQQGFSAATYSPSGAVTYCTMLATAGGGWRLPNILELRSIADETRWTPAIDTTYFPSTPSEYFWSSNLEAGSATYGWGVDFDHGSADSILVAIDRRVRCVR